METLDHQNIVVNGQAEELALLRSKMRNFEYLMDEFKQRRGIVTILLLDTFDQTCLFQRGIINPLKCRRESRN